MKNLNINMKHLIDKDKFLAELKKERTGFEGNVYWDDIEEILSKHTKAIVDEPHHPSGKDREAIDVRNELREKLRNE